jgi:hypothetical protein
MISVKTINSYRTIVAICDEEILGKYFDEGKFQLDVKESFYKGELVTEEEAFEIMQDMVKEDASFNIVGENSIKIALNSEIITQESVGKIAGIPFAIILL